MFHMEIGCRIGQQIKVRKRHKMSRPFVPHILEKRSSEFVNLGFSGVNLGYFVEIFFLTENFSVVKLPNK